MSLNVVTRRHRTRMWPQAIAAVLVLAGIACWVVSRSTPSPSHPSAAGRDSAASPYTRPELEAALLTARDTGRDFRIAHPVHRIGDVRTSTGCVQLDSVEQSLRTPSQLDAYRNFAVSSALPAVQEQIDSEAAADVGFDFATAVAALGTCHHLHFEIAPGKHLNLSMRATGVRIKGVEVVGRILDGSVGLLDLHGFLGVARPTASSLLIFRYLIPRGSSDSLAHAVAVFDHAVRKARHDLSGVVK